MLLLEVLDSVLVKFRHFQTRKLRKVFHLKHIQKFSNIRYIV